MGDKETVSCAACLICFIFPTLVSETSCCHRPKGKLDSISHFCSLNSIHMFDIILIGKALKQNGDCFDFFPVQSFQSVGGLVLGWTV